MGAALCTTKITPWKLSSVKGKMGVSMMMRVIVVVSWLDFFWTMGNEGRQALISVSVCVSLAAA